LVDVKVNVPSRSLEDLLDALARLDFPINPEIRHGYPDTTVEFPAYDTNVSAIEMVLRAAGIIGVRIELANMLRAIA
jgi:hypothetical protein